MQHLDQTNLHNQDLVQLEALIDRRGLHTVLSMLSEICSLKEQHLIEYWRADYVAKTWRTYELKLDKLALNCPI